MFIDVARKQISRLTKGMSFLSVAITLRLEQKKKLCNNFEALAKKTNFFTTERGCNVVATSVTDGNNYYFNQELRYRSLPV